jgi:hypothetical protein
LRSLACLWPASILPLDRRSGFAQPRQDSAIAIKQTIAFDAAFNGERMRALTHLPCHRRAPLMFLVLRMIQ